MMAEFGEIPDTRDVTDAVYDAEADADMDYGTDDENLVNESEDAAYETEDDDVPLTMDETVWLATEALADSNDAVWSFINNTGDVYGEKTRKQLIQSLDKQGALEGMAVQPGAALEALEKWAGRRPTNADMHAQLSHVRERVGGLASAELTALSCTTAACRDQQDQVAASVDWDAAIAHDMSEPVHLRGLEAAMGCFDPAHLQAENYEVPMRARRELIVFDAYAPHIAHEESDTVMQELLPLDHEAFQAAGDLLATMRLAVKNASENVKAGDTELSGSAARIERLSGLHAAASRLGPALPPQIGRAIIRNIEAIGQMVQ